MTIRGEKRRYSRRRPFASQSELNARMSVDGSAVNVRAKLVDVGRGGLSIQLPHALEHDTIVHISGDIDDLRGRQKMDQRCAVRSCRPSADGNFVIGLAYEAAKAPE